MPSVVDPAPRFVVVPLEPYLVALAATVPGAGRPTEMWIGLPDAAAETSIREALADDPFRFAEVIARSDLVAERATDPLSRAILWTLLIAAFAGLTLSVSGLILGAVTDLRDERGELADLEAQGVTPTALRTLAVARTTLLALGGCAAGLVVGLSLTQVVTGALSVTAEGVAPIPPLAVVIPVIPILAVIAMVLALVIGSATVLARRAYGRATLGERRAAGRSSQPGHGWQPSGEQVDG
jgi:hypothetical protein